MSALAEFVEATATGFDIPGVAVGVVFDGQEHFATHGVTSLENPLPVDRDTLFIVGSVTKTFTATTLMRLVADGRVELDAPVGSYVPELPGPMATSITILHLLNHTAGLDWGMTIDTGEGDDAIARYVAQLANLPLILEPGTRASYSQAGYNLLGRVIEKVTGLTFEHAVTSLVVQPLVLTHSFFDRDDIMTRRFAVGHNRADDGSLTVARLWRRWRGDNPGGGLVSSVADLLRWARFHLLDRSVTIPGVTAELVTRMQEPTVALRGSALGDAIGVSWFLREVEGMRTVGHAGSANGQFAEVLLVPERGFAVASLANAGPEGIPFNQAVVRWALETFVGVHERDPEPLAFDETRAQEVIGSYENEVMTLAVDTSGTSVRMDVRIKPAIRAAADKELPPDHAPFPVGFLAGDGDEYIVGAGAFKGQRGFFTRDASGAIVGVDLAGRLFTRRGP